MKKILFILTTSLFLISCSEEFKKDVKSNSSGKAGEVLVVISESNWKGAVGDTIFYSLSAPFEVLPQDEPFFEVMHIPTSSFENIFKNHRNIIIVDIKKEYNSSEMKILKDKWAFSQLVFHFKAPSDTAFITLWSEKMNEVKSTIFDKDIQRFQESYSNYLNKDGIAKVKQVYNIDIQLPTDYTVDVTNDHFCWISKETPKTSQGIFIYDYPYEDTSDFSIDSLIIKRDKITKDFVPGPKDGTFMQTEKQVPFRTQKIEINGRRAVLVRGLWYIENYFLGGPFVSISMLDETRNRIVTVEAYIYAGKLDKKIYVWQTESIIKTIKIVE